MWSRVVVIGPLTSQRAAGLVSRELARIAEDRGDWLRGCHLEAIRPIGHRINRRRLAAHDFGEQPAGRGSQRKTLVAMAEIHPETAMARCDPEHRQHVGCAGSCAEPGLWFDTRAKIEQLARRSLCMAELDRRCRCIRARQFGAGGDADSFAIGAIAQPLAVSISGRSSEVLP